MATGGIFTLITNDGKQDRMLMATQLLNSRLQRIAQIRSQDPRVSDPTPTLADIEKTHVLFMNAHFKPFAAIGYEYNKVRPQSGTAQLGGDVTFSIPQFGDFFNDMVLHMVLDAPTVSGTDTVGAANTTYFNYCDFPGHRLAKKVQIDVNGNPLDEYTSDAYNFHYQFCVTASKKLGWKRCVGQETEQTAYVNQLATVSQSHREGRKVFNGPQTPKPVASQGALELWVPLLFWFNKDPRLAIPSVSIPYGQRFINVTLESLSNMAAITLRGSTTGRQLTAINISTCELYINNIFVNPEIHDIYIHRIGFSLIRVHRRQLINVNKSADEQLLQQLKWPIETLFVGMRPTTNITPVVSTGVVSPHLSNWWKNTYQTTTNVPSYTQATDGAGVVTGTPELFIGVQSSAPTIDRLTITAHGVPIYNDIPSGFFNNYTPVTFGGSHIATPEDVGSLMIPFNLYPGSYQPSGHINVSRAREFYFKYASSVVPSLSATADLIVYASALNFLLISDGSAVLRYST